MASIHHPRAKFLLALIAAPLLLYPLALTPVILADSLLGDAEFLRHFLLESKRGTIKILLSDWLLALPWCLLFWLATRGLAHWTPRLPVNTLLAVLALGLLVAAIAGFFIPSIVISLLIIGALLNLIYQRIVRHSFATEGGPI